MRRLALVPTLILARHGRTEANATGLLAGRTPGVVLDEAGRAQAEATALRLRSLTLAAAVSSPLERCQETAGLLLAGTGLSAEVEDGITECDYGEWTGRPIKELVKEELWRTVQARPSQVRFPGGESMSAMSARAVAAVREWDRRVADSAGESAVWLAVSHGDVIKSILADALAMELDHFQRIVVDPASLSIVRYAEGRAYVLAMNSTAGDLSHLARQQEEPGERIGGGAGPTVTSPSGP